MTAISLTTFATLGAGVALAVLVTATGASVLGFAALRSNRALHRRLDAMAAGSGLTPTVPAARSAASVEEIRTVVAEALAEERERELAEARAFWAAQDSGDGPTMAGYGTEYEVAPDPAAPSDLEATLLDALLDGTFDPPTGEVFIPRQADSAGEFPEPGKTHRSGLLPDVPEARDSLEDTSGGGGVSDSAELAAARRRHPSHPDYNLDGEPHDENTSAAPAAAPTIADHERTVELLGELADTGTPLTDVRQGPLGTLDVYVFEDGTTVCLSPGHPETAGRLCEALRQGDTPLLVGGSGVSGAYTLTFTYGGGRIAYLLADRVIASL